MGIGKVKCDLSELIELRDRVQNLADHSDQIMTALANEIAARLLRKTRKRTPTVTGTLKRGWYVGDISVSNGLYTIEIINNVEYAPYVEYGHRTKNHKGWVKGRYMLTVSENEINEQLDRIVRKKLEKLLKDVFK